ASDGVRLLHGGLRDLRCLRSSRPPRAGRGRARLDRALRRGSSRERPCRARRAHARREAGDASRPARAHADPVHRPHGLGRSVGGHTVAAAPRGYDPGVNDRFLRACRLQEVDRTPVWFMRQAGRYMPEYRALRAQHSLLTLCRTPELAVQVTLQPVDALGVDAAILFSDLLLPLAPLGIPFDFVRGEGPAIETPLRNDDDLARVHRFEPRESLGYVLDAIRQIKRALAARVPLIGFAGAPFTLASYAIEGGHSTNFAYTKSLMYGHPQAWHRFAGRVAGLSADY